jgi:hypothetical protein
MRPKKYSTKNALDRFHSRYAVDPNTGCWNWIERWAKVEPKYPHFYTVDRGSKLASHFALEVIDGLPQPEGRIACHLCDNPRCVNPKHLYWGTYSDNMQDRDARGPERYRTLETRAKIGAGVREAALRRRLLRDFA